MDAVNYLYISISELKILAEKGDAEAQYHLAGGYKHGLRGLNKNLQQAVKWYQCAAKQEHMLSQHNLAVCYDDGQGVIQDKQEATKWYKCAAGKGYKFSQHNLAQCYDNGQGVIQDKQEAAKWYKYAAEQGLAASQYNYGACCFSGEGVTEDKQEAKKWFLLAAGQRHDLAIGILKRWGNPNPSEEILLDEKKVELNQKTISFFNGFVSESQWKNFPTDKLIGKYIGHKVQFFTMPANKVKDAENFTQTLQNFGFDAELKAAKAKPSVVVDLTTSKLLYKL